MNKSSLRILIVTGLCAASLLASSCRTYRGIDGRKYPKIEASELWQVMDTSRLAYSRIAARTKLDFRDSYGKQSGIAMIHIQRDSLIWISLRKAGLEGARILISPDSLKILDRGAKVYVNLGYDALEQGYGINVPFARLQDLIVGDPPVDRELDPADLMTGLDEEDRYVLEFEDEAAIYTACFNPYNLLLEQFHAESKDETVNAATGEILSGGSMDIFYTDWSAVQGQAFALKRLLTFSSGEFAELSAEFSRVEIDPDNLTFAFSVNPKYREVNSLEELGGQYPEDSPR